MKEAAAGFGMTIPQVDPGDHGLLTTIAKAEPLAPARTISLFGKSKDFEFSELLTGKIDSLGHDSTPLFD
jgi:hypothetical protein